MRFAIIYSKLNIAGTNIANCIKNNSFLPQIPIIELKKETLYSDDISEKKYPELKNIDFVVFASTHRSEKSFPTLCIHAPGNFRNADMGGKPGKICKTSAIVLKYLFKKMNEIAKEESIEGFDITMEATHHGPLMDIPCCFIEIGSTQKEWDNEKAIKIIARSITSLEDFDKNKTKDDWIPAIGIGGPHYAPNFNKIQNNSEYALSHIIASYNNPVTENMIKEAESKTTEQIKEVIIDWKSFNSSERSELTIILKNLGMKYKRTSEIEK
jgi:D-aminoacyl-tRNA deacylase